MAAYTVYHNNINQFKTARKVNRAPSTQRPEGLIANQTQAAEGQIANQDVYLSQMTEAHQKFAQGQIDAADAGASQAAGGVNRGTSITIGGINQGASLEQRANRITFDGSVKAAGQVRDAAIEACAVACALQRHHAVGP